MRSRRHSVSVIRPAIALLVVVVIIAVMYIGFGLVVGQWIPKPNTNSVADISAPAIVTLPTDRVFNQQFIDLQQIAPTTYASQTLGVAEQYPKPAPPEQLKVQATPFGASVVISWTLPLGESVDAIEIYRSTTADTQTDQLARVNGTTVSYFDLGISDNVTYYYSVRAIRQLNGTDYVSEFTKTVATTSTDTVAPANPANIIVTRSLDDPSTLVIQWQAVTSEPIDRYTIYRSTEAGTLGSELTHVAGDVTSYTDKAVNAAKAYYYTVTAVDFAKNESVSTLATAPAGNSDLFVSSAAEVVEKLSSQ